MSLNVSTTFKRCQFLQDIQYFNVMSIKISMTFFPMQEEKEFTLFPEEYWDKNVQSQFCKKKKNTNESLLLISKAITKI